MNVIFLSPAFPPTAAAFCTALAQQGVKVLGIGDERLREGSEPSLALSRYVYEPRMADYDVLRGVVTELMREHGPIHRVDSNGEHWLEAEARLRDDFDIPGLRPEQLRAQRSKLDMARTFLDARIDYPATAACSDPEAVRALAREHGYPLVLKPESGSGAADTFMVHDAEELRVALERPLPHHLAQPFIQGDIVTYDGLADREGRIVFSTSHVYDTGIMQVRQSALDGHYWSLRELPAGLEELGRRAVAAFDVRERFFHLELFMRPDSGFTALEMNLRPPGGFTTDMMSAAFEVDIYGLWAAMLSGRDTREMVCERHYHTAHAGRRAGRGYRLNERQLELELGGTLLAVRAVPAAFSVTMGDVAYLLRDPSLERVRHAIALVQAT